MNRIVILMFLVLSVSSAFGALKKTNCMHKNNKLCQSIKTLNPKMSNKDAYDLSNIFYSVAKKYHLDPKLLVSIAYQESSFNPSVIRKMSGLVFDEKANEYKKIQVGSDFCMMQIHISNIAKMNLDAKKLLESPRYCIETGAKILAKYKEKSKEDSSWWTLYNAKTGEKRAIYYRKVARHLVKLNYRGTRGIASKPETTSMQFDDDMGL